MEKKTQTESRNMYVSQRTMNGRDRNTPSLHFKGVELLV